MSLETFAIEFTYKYYQKTVKRDQSVIMSAATTDDKPTLTLFRGWKDPGRYVWSPFVIKLEARLRFAGIKYAVDVGSPRTAPKGKVPYVEFGSGDDDSKQQIGDSGLIIKTLVQQGTLPDLNAALSGPERARDLALRALLEDKLYFYHVRRVHCKQ